MHITLSRRVAAAALAALVLIAGGASAEIAAEDRQLIDAAGCADLIRELGNYSAAEKEVADDIRQSTNGTIAANALGAATFATLGFGFFTWDDNSDAQANLAELREIRMAIDEAARKKSCPL